MLARLAAVALLALAIPPSTAHAAAGDKAGYYVAEQTWGIPQCGTPRLEVSTPTDYLTAHGTGVFAAEPDAWADPDRCAIVINPNFTIRTAAKRCHVIVHEWGHLAGHGHSENPRSVMFGEDNVTEGRVKVKRRLVWEASGAFRPCAAATEPGVSFG